MNGRFVALCATVVTLSACGHEAAPRPEQRESVDGAVVPVRITEIPATIEASGTAQPIAQATLSTKLMATVTAVHAREGDRVRAGQVLAVLDARDLAAKGAQVEASLSAAVAMQQEAEVQAKRMRVLFAQEAAPRAQLDAAETALARANAAVAAAHAGSAELSAVRDYALIRAPFDGVVTQRFVDPGAFAAPGAPLITVQDTRRLRIEVTASPDAVRSFSRGDSLDVRIEGVPSRAVVEGTVPAGGAMYRVNAVVSNPQNQFLAGSAATVMLPAGTRSAMLIPASALRRQGDLTGVLVSSGTSQELRWVRLGRRMGDEYEVLAGLRNGENIVVPARIAGVR